MATERDAKLEGSESLSTNQWVTILWAARRRICVETRLGYDGLYQKGQVHVITDFQTNSRQIHKITPQLRKCGSVQPLEDS